MQTVAFDQEHTSSGLNHGKHRKQSKKSSSLVTLTAGQYPRTNDEHTVYQNTVRSGQRSGALSKKNINESQCSTQFFDFVSQNGLQVNQRSIPTQPTQPKVPNQMAQTHAQNFYSA